MKVHLIRSEGFKMEDYNDVFNILNQYSGGITFVPSEPIILPDTDLKSPLRMKLNTEDKTHISQAIEGVFRRPFFSRHRKGHILGRIFQCLQSIQKCIIIPSDEQVFLLTDQKK